MVVLAAPMLAIVFGAFLVCAETCLHLNEIANPTHWTDLPIYDWVAGGFLVYAGVLGRRDWSRGRPYQAAAWGFVASLLIGAFTGHWEAWAIDPQPSDEGISDGASVGILGALMAVSVAAMMATIRRLP